MIIICLKVNSSSPTNQFWWLIFYSLNLFVNIRHKTCHSFFFLISNKIIRIKCFYVFMPPWQLHYKITLMISLFMRKFLAIRMFWCVHKACSAVATVKEWVFIKVRGPEVSIAIPHVRNWSIRVRRKCSGNWLTR